MNPLKDGKATIYPTRNGLPHDEIASGPGQGTRVTAVLPLSQRRSALRYLPR